MIIVGVVVRLDHDSQFHGLAPARHRKGMRFVLKMLKISHEHMKTIFLSSLSGLILTLSFPKAGLSGLSWVAFIPLFYILRNASPKKSFLAGLCFGFVHFLSLLYWVVYVLHTYGYVPLALCLPMLALLALYLALYPAVFSLCLVKGCKNPAYLVVLAPALWVCLEYIRTYALSGFPWELLGYSQHAFTRIIQMADVTGVYGVSFLIMLVNGGLFVLLLQVLKTPWQGRLIPIRTALGQSAAIGLCFICALAYGELRLKQTDAWVSAATPLTVSVIQGNIDQSLKWTPSYQRTTLDQYSRLSSLCAEASPDLIVWPETAAPFYYGNDKALTLLLQEGISGIDAEFLIGFPTFIQKKNRFEFYNSAYLMDRNGAIKDTYSKVHLVPFGEYVPMKKYLPFINKLTEQSGDFYSGTKGETLTLDRASAGIQICFEVIFPSLTRAMVQNGAQILVNITNDAWFGKTSAPYQHFSMVRFRAVENKRAMARAANTGISGFIDPAGRILATSGLYTEAALTRALPLLDIPTFYTRYGDLFTGLCFFLLAFFLCSRDRAVKAPKAVK